MLVVTFLVALMCTVPIAASRQDYVASPTPPLMKFVYSAPWAPLVSRKSRRFQWANIRILGRLSHCHNGHGANDDGVSLLRRADARAVQTAEFASAKGFA